MPGCRVKRNINIKMTWDASFLSCWFMWLKPDVTKYNELEDMDLQS